MPPDRPGRGASTAGGHWERDVSRARDRIVRTRSGGAVPLLRVMSARDLGLALRPGVVVETSPAAAERYGALSEDCGDEAEALEAAEDPAAFATDIQGELGNG